MIAHRRTGSAAYLARQSLALASFPGLAAVLMFGHSVAQVAAPSPVAGQFAALVHPGSVDQLAALEARPSDEDGLVADIARLERELTPLGQLDYRISLNTTLNYRGFPGGNPGEAMGDVALAARLDLAQPADTLARTRQELLDSRAELASHRIEAVEAALLAHAQLLVAQERHGEAAADLTAAQGAAAPDEADTAAARLELREAELDLRAAREDAIARGLPSHAHYVPLRFRLPDAALAAAAFRESPDYLMLELELVEAQAELEEARQVLDDLRLGASYRIREGQVQIEGGLINGLPRANFGLSNSGGPERWQVWIGAQLVLGGRATSTVPPLQDELAAIREGIESYGADYRRSVEAAFEGASVAEEWLTLMEAEVRTAYAEHRAAVAELAALESERGDHDGSAVDAASPGPSRLVERAHARVDSRAGALGTARLRLYRTWIDYVRKVSLLLQLTGGGWEPVPP